MNAKRGKAKAEWFFSQVTARAKSILVLAVILVLGMSIFLPQLRKESRSDAFIPADDPALIYRDRVKEVFGLGDPMIVAVVNRGTHGIFTPHSLQLLAWLTRQISDIPEIDPNRVTSLATEKNFVGHSEGVSIEPFFVEPPLSQKEADRIRQAVMDSPLYLGTLVARNGEAAMIVAELADPKEAETVYRKLLELAARAPVTAEEIHVAGEGAVSGYLGSYIDADVMRLNPFAFLIITGVLLLSYRTWRGVLLPLFVVVGTIGVTLGAMAALEVPVYPITSALPVILVAIGVADSIHILGEYYEGIAANLGVSAKDFVVRSMVVLWRPVMMTSVTDIGGFVALFMASAMPPMRMFGLFAALGASAALIFSLLALPSVLVLLRPKGSPAFSSTRISPTSTDRFGRAMGGAGQWAIAHPRAVIVASMGAAVISVLGVSRLQVNEDRIRNFQRGEPIYQASRIINHFFDGSHYLDVVIETSEPEGLFKLENLRHIEALQNFMKTLPHVKGATSLVDYLKQINRGANEHRPQAYCLPDSDELVAQYFLLNSAGDLGVDFDYQFANVRVTLDSGLFREQRLVVEAAERYIHERFNAPGITARLDGRVHVDYRWMKTLGQTHVIGVAAALLGVLAMAAIGFRSFTAGLLAVLPVSFAVLMIYGAMGLTGTWLGIGTSMFAAIAVGIGVNFAIHMIGCLIALVRRQGKTLQEALTCLFRSTGRALLFDFAAVFFGFGLLTTSQLPPLIQFGAFTALGVLVSFLASFTLLPVIIQLLQPAFLRG